MKLTKNKYLPISRLKVPDALWDVVWQARLKDENSGLLHLKSRCQSESLHGAGFTRNITTVVGDTCSHLETLLLHPHLFKPDYVLSLNTYEYMRDRARRLYLVQLSQVADWARCPVYLAYTDPDKLKTGFKTRLEPGRFFKYSEELTGPECRLRVLKLSNHKET